MADLKTRLYDYLKTKNQEVALADICKSEEFSETDRKVISRVLVKMGEEHIAFRKVVNGKAYYSLDENNGEDMNPSKEFIRVTAKMLGGSVNRNDSPTDISFNFNETDPLSNLFNAINGISDTLKDIAGEDEDYQKIEELTYNQNKVFKGNGYSIKIPDQFILKTEDIGDRDFIAYYPSADDPDDEELAIATIYGSKELPFATANNPDAYVINPEVLTSFFLYEQLLAFKGMLQVTKIYKHVYTQEIANSIGVCSMTDGGAYFYYLNIPANKVAKMIRLDILETSVANEIEANKISNTIFKNIEVELATSDYTHIDDFKHLTGIFTQDTREEIIDIVNTFANEGNVYNQILNNIVNPLLEIKIMLGDHEYNEDDINAAAKEIIKYFVTYKTNITQRMYDQLLNLFDKVTESNLTNPLFLDFHKELSALLNEDDAKKCTINFGETVISAENNNYSLVVDKIINNKLIQDKIKTEKVEKEAQYKGLTDQEKAEMIYQKIISKKVEGLDLYPETSDDDEDELSYIENSKRILEEFIKKTDKNIEDQTNLMYQMSFTDIYDKRLRMIVEMIENTQKSKMSQYDRRLDDIKESLEDFKNEGASRVVLKAYVDYYDWLQEQTGDVTLNINDIQMFKIPKNTKHEKSVKEWKEFVNNLPRDPKIIYEEDERKASLESFGKYDELNSEIKKLSSKLKSDETKLKEKESKTQDQQAKVSSITNSLVQEKEACLIEFDNKEKELSAYAKNLEGDKKILDNDVSNAQQEIRGLSIFKGARKRELEALIKEKIFESTTLEYKIKDVLKEIDNLKAKKNEKLKAVDDNLKIAKEELDNTLKAIEKLKANIAKGKEKLPLIQKELEIVQKQKEEFRISYILENYDFDGNKI